MRSLARSITSWKTKRSSDKLQLVITSLERKGRHTSLAVGAIKESVGHRWPHQVAKDLCFISNKL